MILFSHHAIQSLKADVPDEAAGACIGPDSHGHDGNPGCDIDPRDSSPIHLGDDLTELLHRYPNVIAWIAGHSHVNDVQPYKTKGSGFWMIRTAAEADWPQQARLIQLFDNRDKTLSIFGTIVDHASPVAAPASRHRGKRLRPGRAGVDRAQPLLQRQPGRRPRVRPGLRRGQGEGPQRRAIAARSAAPLRDEDGRNAAS